VSGIPEARQLQEILPEAPTLPINAREEYRQVSQRLTEKILDRAASDPTWKQLLLDDRATALRAANFPEIEKLDELRHRAEVEGQMLPLGGHYYPYPCPFTIH
jgi:hypothetical protein